MQQNIVDSAPDRRLRNTLDRFRGALATVLRNWRLVAAILCIGSALTFVAFILLSGKLFWDFAAYRAGVAAYQATGNAYDPQVLVDRFGLNPAFKFVYPPLILLLFSHLSWFFSSAAGRSVLVLVHTAAFIAIPLLSISRDLKARDSWWLFGFFLVVFGLSGAKLYLSGNISALLYVTIIWSLRHSMRVGRFTALLAAVFLVAQVKIYFIALLIIPFLLQGWIVTPVLTGILIIGAYVLNYLFAPALFREFAAGVAASSQGADFVGISVMSGVQAALGRIPSARSLPVPFIALAAHCVYALAMVAFATIVMWTRRLRGALDQSESDLTFCWALTAALLLSPHLQPYDLAPLAIPFVIMLRHLLLHSTTGPYFVGASILVSACLATTPLSDWAALPTLLGIWCGISVYWLAPPVRLAVPGRALSA
jgi:hypothetical protein